MADLNALIAQGYQFQPPSDPFVQYGRMQQLEQGQQTNQLNRMKMQEAQRAMEETNALRRLDPASATYLQDVTKLNPKLGFEFAKSQREAKTADTEGQIKSTKLVADKLALLPDAYRMADTPEAYLAVHKSVHADPVLGPYLQSLGATPEKGLAQLDEAVQTGKFDQFRMRSMQSVSQLLDSVKPVYQNAAPGATVLKDGVPIYTAPAAPSAPPAESPLAKLQREMATLPPGDSRRAQYVAAINKETTRAPGTVVNIDSKQQGAFEAGLGKGQSDRILANQVVAQDAAAILETNKVGRDLLKAGAITGTGADFLVGFNNALKQAGVDFGYADAAANSQAYAAAMGANVGRIIKQFGAGTGLSDADREYAAQIAGGKIGLTEASLRKILEINDKAANRVIDLHNKNVSGIKTNIPLTVEKPTFAAPPLSGASLIPGSTPAAAAVVPQGAIDALKAGKGTDAQFDAIFGAGAAKRAKGGK
jgi:hypothetical protein